MSRFLQVVLLGTVLCGCSIRNVSALPKQPSSNHAVLVGTTDQDLYTQVILASGSSSSNNNKKSNNNNNYNQQLVNLKKEVNDKITKVNDQLSVLKDRIITSSKKFGDGEPFMAVVGVVGNVPVGICLATLWILRSKYSCCILDNLVGVSLDIPTRTP
jgi:hypothetical protein